MTRGDRERLRADLAGKAMQGALSGILSNQDLLDRVLESAIRDGFENELEYVCIKSVQYADALLAELDRTAEDPIKAGGTE